MCRLVDRSIRTRRSPFWAAPATRVVRLTPRAAHLGEASAAMATQAQGLEDITWDEIDKVRYYILGPAAFLGVRAAVYPSSLVKTRLQVQSRHAPIYSGTFDAFRKILRSEGPRGLYKGFGASTANVLTGNLYISVYEKSRKTFRDHTPMGEKLANFAGGAFASLVSQTVVVPLDIVSQRMMLNNQGVDVRKTRERAKGLMAVAKEVYVREGLRGFYRGYFPSIVTYAPSSAIWWGSYGLLVPVYYGAMGSWNADPFWKQVLAQALSGGTAGIISGILTNPMDIVRTRTQVYTQYGAIETARFLIKRDGPLGLMTGVSARLLSMGPSGVLVVTSYEFVKRMTRKPKPETLEDEN